MIQHSNRLSVLFALCIGLEETSGDDGSKLPLMDINEYPFKLMKKKKDIKPSLDVLREEVKRRGELDHTNTNKPKPNGWNAKKCHDWLKANPITSDQDVAFLLQRVMAVKQVVANATQKTVSVSGNQPTDGEQGSKWFGPLPYLRLIHCLMEDDVKAKWIRRNAPKTIQQIDARRSEVRDEDVFEMIANRWNSSSFNPTTMISNCHYDFSQEIDIGYDATAGFARASPTKVRDKLAKMKTDLTSIINKWERSGQGEGGRLEDEVDDDDEFEHLEGNLDGLEEDADEPEAQQPSKGEQFEWGRSEGRQGAFDCRESFLGSNPSYLLYFWDVLNNNDLFNTTMNRMSDEAGASSPNEVPCIVAGNSSRSTASSTDEISVFVQSFKAVLVEATIDATKAADRRHAEKKEDTERRHKEAQQAEDNRVRMKTNAADNRVILQASLDHKGYLKRRINDLQDEARKIRFKIFASEDAQKTREEAFYRSELGILEREIAKCNDELGNP